MVVDVGARPLLKAVQEDARSADDRGRVVIGIRPLAGMVTSAVGNEKLHPGDGVAITVVGRRFGQPAGQIGRQIVLGDRGLQPSECGRQHVGSATHTRRRSGCDERGDGGLCRSPERGFGIVLAPVRSVRERHQRVPVHQFVDAPQVAGPVVADVAMNGGVSSRRRLAVRWSTRTSSRRISRSRVAVELTVSNQFVALPTHLPVKISKTASRGVQTYHWSWMSVLTNAELLLGEDTFDHPEQRYILSEMVLYFSHPSVSIATFDRMNPEWKELNSKVQAGARLAKSAPEVEASVAAWHQERRDLSLLMSRTLNRRVRQRLSRAHAEDPFMRVRDDSERLVSRHELSCVLEVPDAAAPLIVTADLQRRCLMVSASLAAPQDKQRASSRINWVLRQLSRSDPANIHVRAHWPGRAPDTQAPLAALRENPSLIEAENRSMVPTQFDVLLIADIAEKFAGTRTFIELLEDVVPRFYEQVGQHLRAYVAPPPKPRPTVHGDGELDGGASATTTERAAAVVPHGE